MQIYLKKKYLIIYKGKLSHNTIFHHFPRKFPRNKRNNLAPLCMVIIHEQFIFNNE